jgi:hypothetical protein
MRGLVAVVVALAVASFSGCVELVGEEDPELEAAANEAAKALDEHRSKVGHVSGIVVGADGVPLAGALVDLVTVAQVRSDDAGRFSFLDLAPGKYSLAAEAEDHSSTTTDVDVTAGTYTRPRLELEALPDPEPYMTVHRLDGYSDPGVLGLNYYSCYCTLEGALDQDGLVEVLLEASIDEHGTPFDGASSFDWGFIATTEQSSGNESDDDPYDSDDEVEYSESYGYDNSPMRVTIPAEEVVEGAGTFYAQFYPANGLVTFGQPFTAFVSVFYHEGAAEDYTAFDLE